MSNKLPKTWQAAFKQQGLDPKVLPDVSMLPAEHQKPVVAQYILGVVTKSLNGEWYADYTDNYQPKYFPYFLVKADKKTPSGSGLSYFDCALALDCELRRPPLLQKPENRKVCWHNFYQVV